MEGVLKIPFNSIESVYFDIYSKALLDHQSFRLAQIKSNDTIVQNISQKLVDTENQSEGLILLNILLQQCNLDIVEQKGNNWISSCIRICNQRGKETVASLSFRNLEIFVRKSVDTQELGKSFASNFIGKICESLKNTGPDSYLAALKCLFICLKTYPGSCGGVARGFIERFLVQNFIDCCDDNLVKWSGKCFHLLQQVRGGGIQGISHKVAWKTYQNKLLGSLHKIFDLMFAHCPEFYESEAEKEGLPFDTMHLSNDPVIKVGQLSTRFKTLVNYLITAIRDPFPVAKAIQPQMILNLIKRGLSVTCETLTRNPILDNIAVGAVLPDIHVDLYKVLRTLILTLKNQLNIYHEQILGVFTDTLKWTCLGKSEGFEKAFNELRCETYNTISIWCQTMKYASCVEFYFEKIFKQIGNDMTPFRNEIMLSVTAGARKHMSKKARRQLHKAQNEKSHLGQTHMKTFDPQNTKLVYCDEKNNQICFWSLVALRDMYTYCSCFLKPLILKQVQEKITALCLSLNEEKYSKSNVYSSSLCREKLYDVLSCLLFACHQLCPPPTMLIIELLRVGQTNDCSKIVRKCCADHLIAIEKILHPQKQCLYFPSEVRSIKAGLRIEKPASEQENSDVDDVEISDQQKVNDENLQVDEVLSASVLREIDDILDQRNAKLSSMEYNLKILDEIDGDQIKFVAKENENGDVCIEKETREIEKYFEESSQSSLVQGKTSTSYSKRKILENSVKNTDADDQRSDEPECIEIESSPKRKKMDENGIDIIILNQTIENTVEIGNNENVNPSVENSMKSGNLFDEILATFTDELNEI